MQNETINTAVECGLVLAALLWLGALILNWSM